MYLSDDEHPSGQGRPIGRSHNVDFHGPGQELEIAGRVGNYELGEG